MTQETPVSTGVREMIRRLDQAVAISEVHGCTTGVKSALEDVIRDAPACIDEDLLRPEPGCYARRLLHRDPAGRYTVVIMVWGSGQSTPIHDHAGKWCVECVYRGRIEVTSYELSGDPDSEVVTLTEEQVVRAGVGEAGALIPPFEYHRIANTDGDTAVTVHVYSGEMDWCHRFEPVEGGYRRQRKELVYSP